MKIPFFSSLVLLVLLGLICGTWLDQVFPHYSLPLAIAMSFSFFMGYFTE